MAKGSGMIHPNMATMLGVCFFLLTTLLGYNIMRVSFTSYNLLIFQVITTDAVITSDVWRAMVLAAVDRSFNQVTVSN